MLSKVLIAVCGFVGMVVLVASEHAGPRGPARAAYARPAGVAYPAENPYSDLKSELGRKLFHDPILSASQTISCSTCHVAELSWGDGRPRAIGEGHKPLAFRAPTLLNVAWLETLGWDGKFPDLESVAFAPITAPANMNMTEAKVLERLLQQSEYVEAFAKAFDDKALSKRNIELALATYERSIVSGDAPFDRWVKGDEQAITQDAKRGFDIFNGKGRCFECHSGWAFTDGSFHDIGTASGKDIGRGRLFPTSAKLQFAFKTPTLRNVDQRAPYMHDGSISDLTKVIDLYDRGGIDRPSRSELISPLHLTAEEKADLIAFLRTLTADAPEAAKAAY